jgi:DNA polymerase-3 subunit delta
MTGSVEKALAEIGAGKRRPAYLLHGDELLARAGTKAILEALVPPAQQALSVEMVREDQDLASLSLRLRTVSLFGGTKVVVVHDTKAFISKQNVAKLFGRSLEAWAEAELDRAMRLFLQAVGAAGRDRAFVERAARGELGEAGWKQVVGMDRAPEAEGWLQEVAQRAQAEQAEIPAGSGGDASGFYEEVIRQGVPAGAVLILTAEVVDQRRSLFKLLAEQGFVIDCGVRGGKIGETQMKPELARAKIRELVTAAHKAIEDEAATAIVERTGFSMRALVSEVEKILLYVGARPRIVLNDVLAALSNSREAGVFDLTNAVADRAGERAVTALRRLLGQREAAIAILGLLAGELRTLIVARSALEARLDGRMDLAMPFPVFQARVLPRLTADKPDDDGAAAKLCAMHPFRAFTLLKSASRYTERELLDGLEAAYEADLALKSSGQPEDLILELFVLRLCAGGR